MREVVVSHTDDQGILQLYRMKEDGTGSRQLTFSTTGCRMPSCSSDGKKLVYVEQVGHAMALRFADLNGGKVRTLVGEGMNMLPSWLPDSEHLIWMKVKPQPKQDPARNSQIHIMNVTTGSIADSLPIRNNSSTVTPCRRLRRKVTRSPLSPIEVEK